MTIIRRGLVPLGVQRHSLSNKPSEPPKTSKPMSWGEGLPSPYPLPDGTSRQTLGTVRILRPILDKQNTSHLCVFPVYGPVWAKHKAELQALQVPFDVYLPKVMSKSPQSNHKVTLIGQNNSKSDIKLTSEFHKIIKICWENDCFLKTDQSDLKVILTSSKSPQSKPKVIPK